MINDISERLQWERQLQNFNQDLEQKVQERTRELETEVAERQQTQELLRESEARTRAIVNSAADGIITTNDLGIITGFNAAAEKIFGHSVSDAMGKSVNILLPEEVAGDHDGFIGNFLKTGDAKIIGIGREVEGRRKDGSSFPMELALSATDITGGTIFTGIVRDISERKEAEDKLHHTLDELRQTQDVLVQSEKMASLGGLVAGVAHEINTPVGIGVTASSHLSEAVGNLRRSFAGGTLKKSELEASFETIDQASEMISTNLRRAAELIGSFKQVAVDQSSEEKL